MELEVIFDEPRQCFIKITLPGFYGNTLRVRDWAGVLAPATPLEYLERWRLSNELFEDDVRVLGLVSDYAGPRIAVAHPLVVGSRPEKVEIAEFMRQRGFLPVRDMNIFFDDDRDLLVSDAHAGNFLRNDDGQVFAIDVLPLKAPGKLLAFALGF